jgi:RNA polymerase sigma-70 factor (ECF subfamily)
MLLVSEREQLPVREARAGKPEAWDLLFKRYQLPLYAYVFELVHQEQTSLDIVQETFINAARHLGGLRDDDKFGSWLFGIAHQKCIQHWRKPHHEQVPIDPADEDHPGPDAGPEEILIRKEQEDEFMKLLGELTPPHRAVVLLHLVEDFSLEEIAGITGAQIGTVKSRLHYAKKTLRKLLARNEP